MRLLSDNTSLWLGSVIPGTASSVENSSCLISGAHSVVTKLGNQLYIGIHVTFKQASSGVQQHWASAEDSVSGFRGWLATGNWTVPIGPEFVAPITDSFDMTTTSPNRMDVSATYYDANGADDIEDMYILINDSLRYGNACFLMYRSSENRLYILDSNGVTWKGSGFLGLESILSNEQCSVDLIFSSRTVGDYFYTLNLRIRAASGWNGQRFIWTYVQDKAGLAGLWALQESLTLPIP
jgi:hypothetical protein